MKNDKEVIEKARIDEDRKTQLKAKWRSVGDKRSN